MDRRGTSLLVGLGCLFLVIISILGIGLFGFAAYYIPRQVQSQVRAAVQNIPRPAPVVEPTPRPSARRLPSTGSEGGSPAIEGEALVALYRQLTPGVVNIQVVMEQLGQTGQGAGSGFILDRDGHIVTNNHVVSGATRVTVLFYDGTEERAEIVGTDADSDLAVIRVDRLPDGAHPLPLGDSSQVAAGEWVVAIGNPFGLGGSMTVGIISALGRTIPSGATPFSIPEVLQTDAAINPGNSGGPLLNLRGEVIGVNAQIATAGGVRANAGVGFAIPVNVVKLVAPALIREGAYIWPWLGVQGTSVNLAIAEANELSTQRGAYIDGVVAGSPAAGAGLRGSRGARSISGLRVPMGGDVVTAVDGRPVDDFADLLAEIAFSRPGDSVTLTILRDGRTLSVNVTLAPRPATIEQ